MSKRLMLSLFILSSTLFSCAHIVHYDVTFNGEHYTHNGAQQADNYNDYIVKFTADFGYVMNEAVEVVCNDTMLEQQRHYLFSNNELRISHNAINGKIKITIDAEMAEFNFESNINNIKNYSKAECDFEGGEIDLNHKSITFTLESDANFAIPSKDKFVFDVESRFDKNQVVFNYSENHTKLSMTIPSKLLGCDIKVTIPDAEESK